jgi:hypothetical protein
MLASLLPAGPTLFPPPNCVSLLKKARQKQERRKLEYAPSGA